MRATYFRVEARIEPTLAQHEPSSTYSDTTSTVYSIFLSHAACLEVRPSTAVRQWSRPDEDALHPGHEAHASGAYSGTRKCCVACHGLWPKAPLGPSFPWGQSTLVLRERLFTGVVQMPGLQAVLRRSSWRGALQTRAICMFPFMNKSCVCVLFVFKFIFIVM